MFSKLKAWLSGSSRDHAPKIAGVVTDDRAQAYAETRAAGKDTRRLHAARERLRAETTNELMTQVWGR